MLWKTNEVLIFAFALLGFLAAIEVGFRLGQWQSHRRDDGAHTHLGVLQGAVLGILGLLLGFSLSMAISRFEVRKGLVVKESNDLGTLWLRARFLQPAAQAEVKRLLQDYVAVRIDFHDAGLDTPRMAAAFTRGESLQKDLWTLVTRLAGEDPLSVPLGLLVESLNDVIDDCEERRVALDNHVPDLVVFMLFWTATVALGLIAYGSGLHRLRRIWTTSLVALLLSFILTIILDIDRPRRGLVQVSQDSMLRLRDSLAETKPGTEAK